MSVSPTTMWTVIGISGVLTFALRAIVILRARDPDEPAGTETGTTSLPSWLQVIAPAALGALVLPALVRPEGDWAPFGAEAIAGLVAALIAWRTGSTVWTITLGFACLLVLQAAIGA